MDIETQGLMTSWWNGVFDPMTPWRMAATDDDPRLHDPVDVKVGNRTVRFGGGRQMRHPFLDSITYPQLPKRTTGFGRYPLRKVSSVVVKTIDSSAVTKFLDAPEDVIMTETWTADQLSAEADLFYAFHRYIVTPLPIGRFLGWRPRDISYKSFFIELLDVQSGLGGDEYHVTEMGNSRPFLITEPLTISFKLIREIDDPAGVEIGQGL